MQDLIYLNVNCTSPRIAIPADTTRDELTDKSRFLVKAANLPASNVAAINIPFRGRNLKVAGDRTFDIWTITVINDVDFRSELRKMDESFQ